MLCAVGPTEGWDSGASKGKRGEEEQYSTVPLEGGGLERHAEIDSLHPGNEYLLRVFANNAQGSSPASAIGVLPLKRCFPILTSFNSLPQSTH